MTDWYGKQVVIMGAARQGLALARYLAVHGAQVTLTDRRPQDDLQAEMASLSDLPVHWAPGGHPLSLLDGAGLLCLSGGVPLTEPLVLAAQQRGIRLTNDSQIFLADTPCRVIGITGSAGKTTTTTLVGRMAQAGFEGQPGRVWVGGNIGTPLITSLDEMQPTDLAIMELSSFQLELMNRSPQVAAVLNITPNHLDRHGTMQAYTAAKAHILQHQWEEDVAVLGRDDPGAWGLRALVRGRLMSFGLLEPPDGQEGTFTRDDQIILRSEGRDAPLFDRSLIRLRGEHNLYNVLAACAIAAAAGLPAGAMRAGVEGFQGVGHRLEWVGRRGGADWYNDSIATAPERAMAAIRSFDEPLVLLAGGRDKDLPWENFARLVHQRVDHLIVFGEAAGKILQAVEAFEEPGQRSRPEPLTVSRSKNLQAAVQAAADVVQPGDVVLLSPGGTSFDEFRDFEERGKCFAQWVRELR